MASATPATRFRLRDQELAKGVSPACSETRQGGFACVIHYQAPA